MIDVPENFIKVTALGEDLAMQVIKYVKNIKAICFLRAFFNARIEKTY